MTVLNLGLVKAAFVNTTPPTNQNVIWLDTSVSPNVHKFYNSGLVEWQALGTIEITGATTDATANVVIGEIDLDESSTYTLNINIVGGETDGSPTEYRNTILIGTYRRIGSGNPILIDTVTTVHDVADGAVGTPNLNINVTNDSIEIRVTGTAATAMNWRASIQSTKVVSN